MWRARLLVVWAVAMTTAGSPELNPPATSVFLTPDRFGMVVNERRKLELVDDLGRAVSPSSWSVSDSSVAQIELDGTIAAIGAGTATITADYESLTATADLTVYPSKNLAEGEVRWSVRPLAGNSLLAIHPGSPMEPEDPDVYFVEKSRTEIVIRALTRDGRQKWMYTVSPTLSTTLAPATGSGSASIRKVHVAANASAKIRRHRWGKQITELMNQARKQKDSSLARTANRKGVKPAILGISSRSSKPDTGQGKRPARGSFSDSGVTQGLLAYVVTDAGNYLLNRFEVTASGDEINGRDDLVMLDENRKELWRRSIAGGEMGFALHPDGIVYVVEADYQNNGAVTLRAIDELTGTEKFAIGLPGSFGGRLPPIPGLPSELPDGNLYLPYETIDIAGAPDVLRLLKVSPDGTHSSTVVSSVAQCQSPAIHPHEALPDGHGGVLVTWQYAGGGLCAASIDPVQVTYLPTSGEAQQSSLPLAELQSYFSDNDGDAVLGAEHLLITDGCRHAAGFNLSTSSVDLNWQVPDAPCTGSECPRISIMGVAAGDRLLVNQTGKADGSTTIFVVPPNSNECPKGTCVVTSSVSNATVVGFDFNDATTPEMPGEIAFKKQYFFKYPTSSTHPGFSSRDGGGKVTLP